MTKEKETFGAEGDKGEMIQHHLYMIPENTAECLIWGKKKHHTVGHNTHRMGRIFSFGLAITKYTSLTIICSAFTLLKI